MVTQTSKWLMDEAMESCIMYNALYSRRIVHFLLAFMNSIQAIYNFKSLGRNVNIARK